MIVYRAFGTELLEQVMALYEKEGWDLYTTYPQRVKPAFGRFSASTRCFDTLKKSDGIAIGFF